MIGMTSNSEEVRRLVGQAKSRDPALGSDQDQRPPKATETDRSDQTKAESEEATLARIEQLKSSLAPMNVTLEIDHNSEAGRNVVKVVDRDTGEVLREIPNEDLVRLEASLKKMIGIFFDQTV